MWVLLHMGQHGTSQGCGVLAACFGCWLLHGMLFFIDTWVVYDVYGCHAWVVLHDQASVLVHLIHTRPATPLRPPAELLYVFRIVTSYLSHYVCEVVTHILNNMASSGCAHDHHMPI
jgi:hypothetical protein